MDFPKELKYTKDHEWLQTSGANKAKVGVTAYAIEQLGDIVHMDLPKVGDSFKSAASFGTIESTKTVSDLYMPVTAKVVAVNDALLKKPESLQEDAYKNGWLLEIEVANPSDLNALLDAKAYEAFVKENS